MVSAPIVYAIKREKTLQNKNSKKAVFLIALGLLLLVGAAALVIYNKWESIVAERESAAILQALEDAMQENLHPEDYIPEGNGEDPDLTMPTVEIDGYEYIGRITIPCISIDLPVLAEWDDTRLWINPCRYTGNYKTDDMVICAHNLDSHFGGLLNIGIGEKVVFTAVDGTVYNYIISNRETVQPTSINEMILNMNNAKEEGGLEDWDLTLFTCHLGGQTRCAVRCLRVEE